MTDTPLDRIPGYASRTGRVIPSDSDPWLERWVHLLETSRSAWVLELGCGGGRDSRFLTGRGFDLVAGDCSEEALATCRVQAPGALLVKFDLREPLPFADASFRVVLASLCLHFFPWSRTVAIMAEVRRCLRPGGFLLARVNSTRDFHPGGGHEEVEPHLFRAQGGLRRFFDRADVERLVGPEWKVRCLEEMTVDRYASPKVVWEFVLEK
jgi:SAM-dependent methyltransferase